MSSQTRSLEEWDTLHPDEWAALSEREQWIEVFKAQDTPGFDWMMDGGTAMIADGLVIPNWWEDDRTDLRERV